MVLRSTYLELDPLFGFAASVANASKREIAFSGSIVKLGSGLNFELAATTLLDNSLQMRQNKLPNMPKKRNQKFTSVYYCWDWLFFSCRKFQSSIKKLSSLRYVSVSLIVRNQNRLHKVAETSFVS
ncbi:hypothetical protein M5689_004985 [Euphorbia peplus]|nr:hypothetical protein M5689_004985 [Euphorbia peplus]